MPSARTIFLAASVLTLGLVVLQFLLAGLGIFGAASFDAHEAVGGVLHGTTLLMVLAAALGRLGRAPLIASVALLVLVGLQAALPNATDVLAALHPLVALGIFVGVAQTTQLALRWRAESSATPAAR